MFVIEWLTVSDDCYIYCIVSFQPLIVGCIPLNVSSCLILSIAKFHSRRLSSFCGTRVEAEQRDEEEDL